MKPLILAVLATGALMGQETRREIVNSAANPADDAKGVSADVPDVYAIPGSEAPLA